MNYRRRTAPAFRSALFLAAGIVLQDVVPFQPERVFVASLCLSALLLLLSLCRRFLPFLGPLLCFTGGILLAAGDRLSVTALPEGLLGERVCLAGRVVETSTRENLSRLVVDDACIAAESTIVKVSGAVLVALARGRNDPEYPDVSPGMRIRVGGTLYPIAGPRNPGEPDFGRWAKANGLVGEVTARPPDKVEVLDSSSGNSPLSRAILSLRRALLTAIDRHTGGEEGELLKGLLIGDRSGNSTQVSSDFIRAGVAHVLAVSGSNVAVVAVFLVFVLSLTGLGRAVRSIILAVCLIVYMLLSGAQPPVVRATIMAIVALVSVALGEKVNTLNALGVSGLILFARNSQTLFDVGFQLSFAAVLSLILLYPRLNAAIGLLRGEGWCGRILRGCLRTMAVTLAATLGTLPITAGVFGRVSLVGLVANVVVVPATGLSVLLGGVTAALAPISDSIASLYGAANWGVLRFTLWFTHLCATPEWASPATPWFRMTYTLPFLAVLFSAFSLGSPSRFRKSLIAALGLTVIVVLSRPVGDSHGDIAGLRLTMLDVGQGDAMLVDLPGGRHILVDCGPSGPESDAGKRTVAPFLARQGIDTLDWLLVTHGHRDHTGGIRSLLESVCAREIGAPGDLAPGLSAEIGREVRPLAMGGALAIDPAIRFQVLWPPSPGGRGGPAAGNDRSLVLRLQYGSRVILLAGDAGFAVEEALVRRFGGFIHADGLKVAHHGSASAMSDQFLSAVMPRMSMISVGRNNRFHHPAYATVEKLRRSGTKIFRTDVDGATVLSSDGKVITAAR